MYGWEVVDVRVTLTHTGYYPRQSHAHAQFDKSMSSVGSDFRGLTPLVLLAALQQAGTQVCEPIARVTLTMPTDTLSQVLPALGRLGGIPDAPLTDGYVDHGDRHLAVARVHEFTALLPGLTHGEGFLEIGPGPLRTGASRDPPRRQRSVPTRSTAGSTCCRSSAEPRPVGERLSPCPSPSASA